MMATMDDARFWNRTARKYAADPIKDMAGYERTVSRAKSLLSPTDVALEIGCGTGTTALKLAPAIAHLTAIDISGAMIAIAREKQVRGLGANVEFIVGGVEKAPPIDGGYDAILAFNVLHLVPDLEETLAHAYRLLKPRGLLISKTPCLSEMSALIRLAVPVARWFGKAPFVNVFSGDELARTIKTAGFAVVETDRHGSGKEDPRAFIVARK
jgi:ubiquinone/menaquinone biosynthesis C-methylase UbiE